MRERERDVSCGVDVDFLSCIDEMNIFHNWICDLFSFLCQYACGDVCIFSYRCENVDVFEIRKQAYSKIIKKL